MKILIVGATSVTGKQLAIDYCNDNHEVWALDRNEKVLSELEQQRKHPGKIDLSKMLTYLMKSFTLFPRALWNSLAKRMIK